MPPIAWNPALVTGEEDIDEQHRRLFELAATLQSACVESCDERDRITEAVYALSEYVLEHFQDEEVYMQSVGYPQVGPHRTQHAYLSGRVLQITANHMNGLEVEPESLAVFVTEWLTGHILAEDVRAVAFARSIT